MTAPAFLESALWYAAHLNWRVLPLRPRDKRPLQNDWTKLASTDLTKLRVWWSEEPSANLGVACGSGSGLWVLDIDPRHGGDVELSALEAEHGQLPDTVTSLTGGGGQQYYFRWPQDRRVGNRANVKPGVDVRGEGGQVVLPPSIHPSGNAYAWDVSCRPGEVTLADAPAWLLDLVCEAKAPAAPKAIKPDMLDVIPDGQRNQALFRRACRLRRDGVSESVILADLREVNAARCQPPLDDLELRTIASSSAKYKPGSPYPERAPSKPSANEDLFAQEESRTAAQQPPATGRRGPGDQASDDEFTPLPLTETGNSNRLVRHYGSDVAYCHTWQAWLVWRETHWEMDATREIERLMRDAIAKDLAQALENCEDDDLREDITKWAKRCQGCGVLRNSITIAEGLPNFATQASDWDSHPQLFAVGNGVLSLLTGELQAHDRKLRITRYCPDVYDPAATSEDWRNFVEQLTGGDVDLQRFLARAAGYSMSGDTRRQVVFMLAGIAGSGKSTFTNTIMSIIGSYAYALPFEVFLQNGGAKKNWSLANCEKARMVVCEESGEGRRFSSDVVKLVTGGTPIEVEAKNKQPFSYTPGFKCWFVTNDPPWVSDKDGGFWRRMRLIQCQHLPARRDDDLPARLTRDAANRRAVLAWMVAGARDYQVQGLAEPDSVKQASSVYRTEQDLTAEFLAEETVWGDGNTVPRSELWDAFVRHCGGKPTMNQRAFNERIETRGAERSWSQIVDADGGIPRKVRAWSGLRLRFANEELSEPNAPPIDYAAASRSAPVPNPFQTRSAAPCEQTQIGLIGNNQSANNSESVLAGSQQNGLEREASQTRSATSPALPVACAPVERENGKSPRVCARENPSDLFLHREERGTRSPVPSDPTDSDRGAKLRASPNLGEDLFERQAVGPPREPGSDEDEPPWDPAWGTTGPPPAPPTDQPPAHPPQDAP